MPVGLHSGSLFRKMVCGRTLQNMISPVKIFLLTQYYIDLYCSIFGRIFEYLKRYLTDLKNKNGSLGGTPVHIC